MAQLHRDLAKVLEEELYHVLFIQKKDGTVAVREAYASSQNRSGTHCYITEGICPESHPKQANRSGESV